jgi:hypothetical protein
MDEEHKMMTKAEIKAEIERDLQRFADENIIGRVPLDENTMERVDAACRALLGERIGVPATRIRLKNLRALGDEYIRFDGFTVLAAEDDG